MQAIREAAEKPNPVIKEGGLIAVEVMCQARAPPPPPPMGPIADVSRRGGGWCWRWSRDKGPRCPRSLRYPPPGRAAETSKAADAREGWDRNEDEPQGPEKCLGCLGWEPGGGHPGLA